MYLIDSGIIIVEITHSDDSQRSIITVTEYSYFDILTNNNNHFSSEIYSFQFNLDFRIYENDVKITKSKNLIGINLFSPFKYADKLDQRQRLLGYIAIDKNKKISTFINFHDKKEDSRGLPLILGTLFNEFFMVYENQIEYISDGKCGVSFQTDQFIDHKFKIVLLVRGIIKDEGF